MTDRRSARRRGLPPIATVLVLTAFAATFVATGIGCATSASLAWAQNSPTLPPDARPSETVHLGAMGGAMGGAMDSAMGGAMNSSMTLAPNGPLSGPCLVSEPVSENVSENVSKNIAATPAH